MRRDKRAAAIFLPFLLGGLAVWGGACQGYVFEPVLSGFLVSDTVEIEIPPEISRVDLLFVVDDSGSMRGNQENLATGLNNFISMLEELNSARKEAGLKTLDFQIGVASTSIYQRIHSGSVEDRRAYSIRADSPCLDGTAYQIASGDPFPDGRLMAAGSNSPIITSQQFLEDPADALRQFRENVRLGTCGSGHEQGIEAMRRVLIANPTFFRQKSRLVVVFLSDEEDASDRTEQFISYYIPALADTTPRGPGGGYTDARLEPSLVSGLTPVSYYKEFLEDLRREREGSIAIAAIVSAIGNPPHDMEAEIGADAEDWNCFDHECASACPDYCRYDYCPRVECRQNDNESDANYQARLPACLDACVASNSANPAVGPCYCGGISPGSRYLELAGSYSGNHIMDSICQTDFSDTLEKLIGLIEVDQCITLTSAPHNDNLSLVMVRIERDGGYILCTPPDEPGQQACDAGADWWFDTDKTQLCLCSESQCRLEAGDSYRLSIIAQACSAESPCSP